MTIRTLEFAPINVWTQGSTSSVVCHPIGAAMPSTLAHLVRGSFDLRRTSGNIEVQLGLQYTNDPGPNGTLDTVVLFGESYTSTEGPTFAGVFTDVTALGTRKLFVRFCLVVRNTSGSEVEFAAVSAQLDFEGSF